MSKDLSRVLYLVHQLKCNEISPNELDELKSYIIYFRNEEDVNDILDSIWQDFPESDETILSDNMQEEILLKILQPKSSNSLPLVNWKISAVAASIAICLLSIFLFKTQPQISLSQVQEEIDKTNVQGNVAPNDVPILKLADGTEINLNESNNGAIGKIDGVEIIKSADGEIIYKIDESESNKINLKNSFNTLTTPKGKQFQVNLPDGSKVWLNASSSLKFPISFGDQKREVELIGEAFFEVKKAQLKSKQKPFFVKSVAGNNNQQIEVLGTQFNVNAFENESIAKTTLIEGKIKLTNLKSNLSHVLKPGQQILVDAAHEKIQAVNTDQVLAWKNGLFIFNNLPLLEIMKQLERWYDINVDYSQLPNTKFQGTIEKSASLDQTLEMLEITGGFKFDIQSIEGSSQKYVSVIKKKNNKP